MKKNKYNIIFALFITYALLLFISPEAYANGLNNNGSTNQAQEDTARVTLNTQFMSLDRNFQRIPKAVSVAKNLATGQEYTFEMGINGEIPLQNLPYGKYEISIVQLPEDSEMLKGKKYDATVTREFLVDSNNPQGWTITIKEQEAKVEDTNIYLFDVSLNTQFVTLDRQFIRIPKAVSVAKNLVTNQEYIFEMGPDGQIPHLLLPLGKYEVRVKEVPTDGDLLKGKLFKLSEPRIYEVKINTSHGWTIDVIELEKVEDNIEPEPQPQPQPSESGAPEDTDQGTQPNEGDSFKEPEANTQAQPSSDDLQSNDSVDSSSKGLNGKPAPKTNDSFISMLYVFLIVISSIVLYFIRKKKSKRRL